MRRIERIRFERETDLSDKLVLVLRLILKVEEVLWV